MEFIAPIFQVLNIVGLLYAFFSLIGRINTAAAVQETKIVSLKELHEAELKNTKGDLSQLKYEFERYKDKNDTKFDSVFATLNKHYATLDTKIDELRTLIMKNHERDNKSN
jgi:hypothetical protein